MDKIVSKQQRFFLLRMSEWIEKELTDDEYVTIKREYEKMFLCFGGLLNRLLKMDIIQVKNFIRRKFLKYIR